VEAAPAVAVHGAAVPPPAAVPEAVGKEKLHFFLHMSEKSRNFAAFFKMSYYGFERKYTILACAGE
jgi:hypothetical protein